MTVGMFKIFLGCVSNGHRTRRTTSFPENLVERDRMLDLRQRNQSAGPVAERSDSLPQNPSTRRFPVTTVTSRGKTVRGTLEVTETEIVLRRHRHEDVRWPLQYVRRYGHEPGIFSFESGRRCESGPGVFTFRSPHAEELFHLIQQNIQDSATTQFGAAVPPVIFERSRLTALANRYVDNTSSGSSPNIQQRPRLSLQSSEPPLQPRSGIADEGDYLRPNSALRAGRHHSAEDALAEVALIDFQPKGVRPLSLTLSSDSPAPPLSAASNRSLSPLVDNVFTSPSLRATTPEPPNPYINVQFDSLPLPFRRPCLSESYHSESHGTPAFRHYSVPDASLSPYVNIHKEVLPGVAPSSRPSSRAENKLDYVTLNVGAVPSSPALLRNDDPPIPAGHMLISGGSLDRHSIVLPGHRKTDSWAGPKFGSRIMPEISEVSPQSSNYALIDSAKTCALKFTAREPHIATSNSRRMRHESST